MRDTRQGEITELLHRWEEGEPGAIEELAPLVYDQLRGIAEACLRHERPEHTLQPTAVVNEVFVDLLRMRRVSPRRIDCWKWKRLLRLGSNQSHASGNNQRGDASKQTETSCAALLAVCLIADSFHSQPVRKVGIRTNKAQFRPFLRTV